MKTSKVILFSYIGGMAVAFLIFVIFLKATDQVRRDEHRMDLETHQIELPEFSNIRIENQNTSIRNAEENLAVVSYHKDSVCPEILWEMEGDTLVIKKSNHYSQLEIKLNHPGTIRLKSKGATIYFEKVKTDSLFLNGTKSTFNGFNNSEINHLQATLIQSRIQSYNGYFKSADVNLMQSKLYLTKPMLSLKGSASNNSEYRIKKIRNINLEMDKSSNLRCY